VAALLEFTRDSLQLVGQGKELRNGEDHEIGVFWRVLKLECGAVLEDPAGRMGADQIMQRNGGGDTERGAGEGRGLFRRQGLMAASQKNDRKN
jgi:hypothetical protein